ncbi:MAG: MurR/RpiR family transcriptional regulator [Erysipelotrichaceae bacterium]|nr:MurR/RpiR family transcriptional regulator [Erysipelotrichaceae bacterium]
MNTFERMKSMANLTHNEEALMSFIMRHPYRFIELKPKEIAREAYVSLSTIYRFADKLGMDGINALKVDLLAALMEKEPGTGEASGSEISLEGSPLQYLGQLKEVSVRTLQQTFLRAEPAQLHQMMSLLKNPRRMVVFTSYANIWFANNFSYQMQEIGRDVQVPIDQYSQIHMVQSMGEQDLAVIVSITGRSTTMRKVGEQLKKRQCPFILVTASDRHPLAPLASAVFWLDPVESRFDELADFTTRTSVLYAFDSIFALYFKSQFQENAARRVNIRQNAAAAESAEQIDAIEMK